MTRTTIDFGIHLTPNSAEIAVLDGTQAILIKNSDNMENTPSAVWIDKNNRLSVGRVAKQRIDLEPENAYTEFMLQMGSQTEYRFAHSGRVMHPEDLTTEVLKSLRADVQQRLGEDIEAAVITVPAAFELAQCDATRRAAQMAGLKVSPLIMEPTAAAMAHAFQSRADKVFWLVYDFGGSTFDAAVIQLREGTFRIVNHAGDNHLGDKLIDWEIVENLLAPAVAKEHHLTDFKRSNPKWRKAFAKLKWEAEEAKMRLSKEESYNIVIDYLCNDDRGEPVPFEFDLKRVDVARLAQPFIQRTINISRQALEQSHLGFGDIGKLIMVGAPTMAPYIREHLEDQNEGLGIRLDYSIDPVTVVVQGAAVFAGTQRLVLPSVPFSSDTYEIELEYEPVGADPEPVVGGKVIPHKGEDLKGFTIEFLNPDGRYAWRSGKVSLAPTGTFAVNLWAYGAKPDVFRIELCDSTGKSFSTKPDRIKYVMGGPHPAPPMIHSIGVALPNNEVSLFIEKGATLPRRQRKDMRSPVTIHKGVAGEKINFGIVEGEQSRADRNRLIGYVSIRAEEIGQEIPAGTEIEITIQVDQNLCVTCSAYVPLLDQEFTNVLHFEKAAPDNKLLELEFEQEKKRLQEMHRKAQADRNTAALRLLTERVDGEHLLEAIETSLSMAWGDQHAVEKAQHSLLGLKIAIDEVEDCLEGDDGGTQTILTGNS